ncbi:MAG: ABC transporter ATP-binding protein [Candidatus Omnitrophota bacterium]|jgi:cobalt/nickel transport system ATP-binding protein
MEKVIFELKDVFFSYLGRFPALCGIDLRVLKGEKISVMGANGTGKSTLLQMLDGLIFPDKGNLTGFGRELKEDVFAEESFTRFFRGAVGFVFQNPEVQLFCPTVREDIMFGPLQLGVDGKEIKRRLDKLADIFEIGNLLERAPYQLSIGEKRKVALASTLAVEPDVILLDEPTAGLDPLTTRHIIDIILRANEEGKTVITATHDVHIVQEISDRVCVFGRGKNIVRDASPDEILSDEKFLAENNLLHLHRHRHNDTVHVHPHLHAHEEHHR